MSELLETPHDVAAASQPELVPISHEGEERQLTPEEEFAEHVLAVRQDGDALDAVESYFNPFKNLAGKVAAAGVITEAVAADTSASAALFTVAGAVVAGKSIQGHIKRKRAFREAQDRVFDTAIPMTKEWYELYRIKDSVTKQDEIVMRWYGPYQSGENVDPEMLPTVGQSLRKVAELARDNDIKAVLVHPELLSAKAELAEALSDATVDTGKWLEKKKTLDIGFRQDGKKATQEVLSYTPDSLRHLAERYDLQERPTPGLDSLVGLLRSHAPEHPLVRVYEDFKSDPIVLHDKIKRGAKLGLERQLEDVTAYRDVDDKLVPRLHKVHRQGRLSGQSVQWEAVGTGAPLLTEKTDVLQFLGLTDEKLRDVLSNPEVFPRRTVVQAAECALYLQTHMPVQQAEVPTTEREETDQSILLQAAAIGAWRNSAKQPLYMGDNERQAFVKRGSVHIGKKIMALCWMMATASGVAGINSIANREDAAAVTASEAAYAQSHHLSGPDALSDDQRSIADASALDGHPITAGILDAKAVVRSAVGWIEREVPYGDPYFGYKGEGAQQGMSGYSNGMSAIGNVPQSVADNRIEWKLTPRGNVDISGYWATDTGTEITGNGSWVDGSAGAEDENLPQTISPNDQDYIRVDQQYIPTQESPIIGGKGNVSESTWRIPVRAGMIPVAANYGGAPVTETVTANGTYVLSVLNDDQYRIPNNAKLTYWLEPTNKGGYPVAEYPLQLDPKSGAITDQVRQEWDKVLPNPEATGRDRVTEESDYIHQHFQYSYSPLSQNLQSEIDNGNFYSANLVHHQLQVEQANCNVASTMVALDNPQLNTAYGYHLDDRNDPALRGKEAHMWLIDDLGTIIDPTPTSMTTTATMENSSQGPSAEDIVLAAGGLLAAAAAGYGARRYTAPLRANWRLSRKTADELDAAWQTVGMVAYGRGYDSQKLKPAEPAASQNDIIAKLAKPHLHDDSIDESLRDAIRQAETKADKKQLKRARTILRLIRNAELAELWQNPDPIPGLISSKS